MKKIKKFSPSLYEFYKKDNYFFPLIGAVLEGVQDGKIFEFSFGDALYVEHHFGFAQIIGELLPQSKEEFISYLQQKSFSVPKVRLYQASKENIYQNFDENTHSTRQRFMIKDIQPLASGYDIRQVSNNNIDEIDEVFKIVGLFWNTKVDFIKHSKAHILYVNSKPVSICYAAALANQCAEIDILTHVDYRKKGYASIAAKAFILSCLQRGITPLWDCFTNNVGSMVLCSALGFIPKTPPYKFLTIAK